MVDNCFFCDIQDKVKDDNQIDKTENFFYRYSDVPVNQGHCEIAPKKHITFFSDLTSEQVVELFNLIKQIKEMLKSKFNPDGFNVGWNEGKAAGQTQPHFHVQVIPRYKGDVENPKGGIRNVIPGKGDYSKELIEKMPDRKIYVD